MRAGHTDQRNLFHFRQTTTFGLSTARVIGPNPNWRTVALPLQPGVYRVQKLAPSNRFQIVELAEAPRYDVTGIRLAAQDDANDLTVTVSLPWLCIYTSNAGEDPLLWIERIA